MALEIGPRLAHYDVTALIGEGGMGQVYQATDTKLKRQVALKILPEAFSADPERLARFQREAEVLASLNHPGIAAIYGLEEADGVRALVLELVEGPTLADRIKRGPIPLDEALPIAKQIAEALEAAHEAGVIHRDLKPANIKVREDGTVKVLDFGLAKALDPSPTGDPSQSPTLTAMATQMGVIMGTAAYMSPEQARGKPVDKRADIWAFGCVLYEMLTGQMAFQGEDVSLTLASVMKSDLNVTRLPDDVPATVRTVLRKCLEKDPTRRVRDIGDVRLSMEGDFETAVTAPLDPTVAPRVGWRQALPPALVALVVGSVVTGVAVWSLNDRGSQAPRAATRATITLPASDRLTVSLGRGLVLSPDGRTLVYSAARAGVRQLYRRQLDQLEPVAIPGTENADIPFFSPEGEWIAFLSGAAMKKVAFRGGPAVTLCQCGPRGATWTSTDTILFGSAGDGLLEVSAAGGGEPRPFLELHEGEVEHRLPEMLPDGRAVLFTVVTNEGSHVAVQSLDTGERQTLADGHHPHLLSTGHLVFGRDGSLWAAPFDGDRLALHGEPVPVVDGVVMFPTAGVQAAFSDDGSLVYVRRTGGSRDRTFVWVDREGREEALPLPPRAYEHPRLSPDGTDVAVRVVEDGTQDIWVMDLARLSGSRITFEGTNFFPTWSPEGTQLAFGDNATNRLLRAQADGTGVIDELLEAGTPQFATSWASDGQALALYFIHPDTGRDLWVLPMDDERTPVPFLVTPFSERAGTFSPDGHWLAYVSDESGRDEVYVRPYPGPGREHTISTEGGTEPVWSPAGANCSTEARTGSWPWP